MHKLTRRAVAALGALTLLTGAAAAAEKVSIAVGGAGCLCYLPTMLAKQLGEYEKAGLDVELINFKGGSDALQAVIGGSADVVSGYYDHCVNLAAKGQTLQAFVVYDRFPGMVLAASPESRQGHQVDQGSRRQDGRRLGAGLFDRLLSEISAGEERPRSEFGERGRHRARCDRGRPMEHGRSTLPSCSIRPRPLLQNKFKDLKILTDVRTQKDTLDIFGGEYPGGALYTRADWIAKNEATVQKLTNAILGTLKWIHAHSAEEIMAKMPEDLVGPDKALYVAALKNMIPMYSETGKMDPKGAQAVLAVFSQSVPEIAKANIDLSKTYTNKYVEAAAKGM